MNRFLALLLILSPMILHSQEIVTIDNAPKKVRKLYEKAEKKFATNDNLGGKKKLHQAIALEARFIDAHLRLGGIYYKERKFGKAVTSFQTAYQLDSSNHKITQALAASYEGAQDYTRAGQFYKEYLSQAPKVKPEYRAEVERKIRNFEFRKIAIKNPLAFDPIALPSQINTPTFSEYSPSLTADGKRMFFTRVTGNQEDIYFSQKDSSGTWSEAILLPNLNTMENEGTHTISANGKIIMFTYCNPRAEIPYRGCNIYASFLKSGRWTKPAFFETINSRSWDTQPNISADGQIVIFVSKRKGGHGESDLWWSKRNTEGRWLAPENLGPMINTSLREESPFLHSDGKTLFFKSEGHPGMGSFDLFRSELQEDGTWSQPVNLGYPINTKDHEGALVVALDGSTAYYSRGDGEVNFDSKGSDLYAFTLPVEARAHPSGFANIRVFNEDGSSKLTAGLELKSSEGTYRKLRTDEDGEALVILNVGENYSLNIEKTEYYLHSERFELDRTNTAKTAFEIRVYLRKIELEEVSEPTILKNVLFETGSFELKPESFFELDNLARLLNENLELKIEIRGHTDNVGQDADNQRLSENRARAVYQYLVAKKVDIGRLSYEGLGETEPIGDNGTEEGRKMNRRTDFISKQ